MIARSKALERHDGARDAARDRDHAGPRRDAVDQHRAGAAFAKPAAVFRSVQFEIVAQHVKQRGIGIGADVVDPAVDRQADRGLRHGLRSSPDGLRLANVALNPPQRYRLYTNVQAGGFCPAAPCPLYEQTRQPISTFNWQRRFWLPTTPHRFPARARHRLYTNTVTPR